MFRRTMSAVVCLVAFTGMAQAQSPSTFFEQPNHDFGTVPRGPTLTHYYRFTNKSNQPVHIAGVRVSCGCVAASPVSQTVAPGESSAIYATMDTRRFSAAKQVTIFVTFDRPQWEEVRLNVTAYGRDDLSLENEVLTFGSVARGATGTAKMTVTLRQPQWVVQSAASDSVFVAPRVKELRRSEGEVVYELAADLKPGLPVGKWVTDINLTTNSSIAPQIRVPVTVEVTPTLSVSPGEVNLGKTPVGQPSETKLLVRGGQPFKIKEIQGAEGVISATALVNESRPVHIITVKFDPKQAGDISRKLKIVTDLPNEGTAEVAVTGSGVK
jgi:hypothetical protein